MEYAKLTNNINIPVLAFGTLYIKDPNIIYEAIKRGYRHIDTAESYENEAGVGIAINRAIKEGLVKREDLFITTKINPHRYNNYDRTIKYFHESLKRLNLDYIDLYLIHAPNVLPKDKWKNNNAEIYRAMEYLYEKRLVKSIGISNFMPHHLEELLKTAKIKPAINQLEVSPQWQNKEAIKYSIENNIAVMAWGALMHAGGGDNTILIDIAKKYSKSPAQICIKWSLQKGYIPVAKTSKPERMTENLDVFDFSITDKDMTLLDSLQSHPCSYVSPDTLYLRWKLHEEIYNKEEDFNIKYKLFNKLSLVMYKRISDYSSVVYLFKFIPLIKKNINPGNKCEYYRLFSFLPILKKKIKSPVNEKLYLFNFLPFMNIKHKKKLVKKINLVAEIDE